MDARAASVFQGYYFFEYVCVLSLSYRQSLGDASSGMIA